MEDYNFFEMWLARSVRRPRLRHAERACYGAPTMFGIGFWELIILGILGLMCLGTLGGIVAAVVIASSSKPRE
jgi:hypothetical protein